MTSSYILYLLLLFIFRCSPALISAQKSKSQTLSDASGVLRLEKLFPVNHNTTVDELEAGDRARQARILRSSTTSGAINFPLIGSFDPRLVGMYYTKVKLRSPPTEYNMLIDTGSDISWISCSSCNNCPRTSELGVELNFYDTGNSSTASVISCSDTVCTSDECSKTNQCSYSLHYGDNSGTTGYYVSDLLYLDSILRTSLNHAKSAASIVFGCSTSRFGSLGLTDRAVDGILGFDQQRLSIISQLSSRGISPKSFSHCLKGEGSGGGILVLREILHPSMVYSPLVPSKGHYNVYLKSISVHGRILPINPVAFANMGDRGTIFDSGTSLVYLVAEAYESVVSAITVVVSPSAKPTISGIDPCYLISSSFSKNVAEVFPTISLNFAGDASMNIRPTDYLEDMGFLDGAAKWCIRFVRKHPSLTILGGVAIKDRIIVYDLARQRIGWANYNCSLPVNVSLTSGTYEVTQASTMYHMLELIMFILYLFWSQ